MFVVEWEYTYLFIQDNYLLLSFLYLFEHLHFIVAYILEWEDVIQRLYLRVFLILFPLWF